MPALRLAQLNLSDGVGLAQHNLYAGNEAGTAQLICAGGGLAPHNQSAGGAEADQKVRFRLASQKSSALARQHWSYETSNSN